MSQQDNFFGGFVIGTLFGGIVGGVAGALVASKLSTSNKSGESRLGETKQSELDLSSEQGIEAARRSLEDKIARLNEAIDDVQHQLEGVEGVNGGIHHGNGEQAINQD